MARNLVRVEITPELIMEVIKKNQGVPDDSELVELYTHNGDLDRRVFTVVCESDEYDEVVEGGYIPMLHEVIE